LPHGIAKQDNRRRAGGIIVWRQSTTKLRVDAKEIEGIG
jgi:hypothetical protein